MRQARRDEDHRRRFWAAWCGMKGMKVMTDHKLLKLVSDAVSDLAKPMHPPLPSKCPWTYEQLTGTGTGKWSDGYWILRDGHERDRQLLARWMRYEWLKELRLCRTDKVPETIAAEAAWEAWEKREWK